mgnify:CR=1 FL=1
MMQWKALPLRSLPAWILFRLWLLGELRNPQSISGGHDVAPHHHLTSDDEAYQCHISYTRELLRSGTMYQ